jgi:uncharacterized membrane protein (DUF2068 family)
MGATDHRPPGTEKPRRIVPRFHYEPLVCGVSGHELFATDVAELRPEDAVFARDDDAVRWHRCVRCDSWIPLPRPTAPARRHSPPPNELELPLRGRALRDKVVLRVIAVDRALHFVVLGIVAGAIFLFAGHEAALRRVFARVVADVQTGFGGTAHQSQHGFLHEIDRLLTLHSGTLRLAGVVAALYALLEGAEAVGLWYQKRWAEYLTFLATTALLPVEIYELARTVSAFKVIALIVNLAIVVYLLLAKRLFGVRGGAAAERAERERDVGWEALARTAPPDARVSARSASAVGA